MTWTELVSTALDDNDVAFGLQLGIAFHHHAQ